MPDCNIGSYGYETKFINSNTCIWTRNTEQLLFKGDSMGIEQLDFRCLNDGWQKLPNARTVFSQLCPQSIATNMQFFAF